MVPINVAFYGGPPAAWKSRVNGKTSYRCTSTRMSLLMIDTTVSKSFVLDYRFRYGESFARSTIRVAGHGFETVLVVFCNLIENDPTRLCRRRIKMQISCRLLRCDLCHLFSLDLSGVAVYHIFGATSELITLRLPLHDRQTVLTRCSGACGPSMVDWEQFDAAREGN